MRKPGARARVHLGHVIEHPAPGIPIILSQLMSAVCVLQLAVAVEPLALFIAFAGLGPKVTTGAYWERKSEGR